MPETQGVPVVQDQSQSVALNEIVNSTTNGSPVPVIDYEGSGYRRDFWEGQGREYEDATERLALRRLLPSSGRRIAEIGAGFGRLADLYLGYEQIVLFDYSRTLLQDAVQQWGQDPRFVFVAGNIYQLPLASGVLDTLVMVRVMHHLADVPQALAQLRRVVRPGHVAVLEYANKRNLKALLRWMLGRQSWSPLSSEPVEFVALNFDFHPDWMAEQMARAGFRCQERLAVSHFRLPSLKRRVPAVKLAALDGLLFRPGGHFPLSPSVFVRAVVQGEEAADPPKVAELGVAGLFRCPTCGTEPLSQVEPDLVSCPQCGRRYQRRQQIWDFKEPVP